MVKILKAIEKVTRRGIVKAPMGRRKSGGKFG